MPDPPIRFYLDEHISHALAKGLRRRGIDVMTAVEAGLRTADDNAHLAYAVAERRLLVTQDEDFLVKAAEGKPNWGIAYSKQNTRSVGELLSALTLLHSIYTADEMRDQVEFI